MAAAHDTPDAAVARIRIRAVPGSRRACVVGPYGDMWKVRVTAAPEGGRANEDLLHLLAEVLGVSRDGLRITAGGASRTKSVEVRGLTPEQVDTLLMRASDQG